MSTPIPPGRRQIPQGGSGTAPPRASRAEDLTDDLPFRADDDFEQSRKFKEFIAQHAPPEVEGGAPALYEEIRQAYASGLVPGVRMSKEEGEVYRRRDRLTVVATAYHQTAGDSPFATDIHYSSPLKDGEQPYSRKGRTDPKDWTPLPAGWLKRMSLLVIRNDETPPRPEGGGFPDASSEAGPVLLVGWALHGDTVAVLFRIPPRQASFIPWPEDLGALRVWCKTGPARFTTTGFPA